MGRDALLQILGENKAECSGISFFLSMKYSEFAQKDVVDLVMIGTKEDGTLIWKETTDLSNAAFDGTYPCPPYCPK